MPTEHVGDVIRRLRIAKGLTQEHLAAAAGVKRSWLSRVELGHRRHPERDMLVDVAAALNEPADRLLAPARYRTSNHVAAPRRPRTPEEILAELHAAVRNRPILVPVVESFDDYPDDREIVPYRPRVDEHGHEFVAVRVCDRAVEPVVYAGHTVVVDRSRAPRHGDLVAAQVDGGVVVRFCEERDGRRYLTAYRDWTPRPADDARIGGVVVFAVYRPDRG
jgi:transcriptional regulator with XRE-family HTH domain